MKKIVFLILFLTGLFPVFNSNGLYLESGKVYGQEDPYGNEVVMCNDPDRVTTEDMGDYYLVETCISVNEDGDSTKDCVWECSTDFQDKPDPDPDPDSCDQSNPNYDPIACNESNCNTTCPTGFVLDQYCNCNEVPQQCYNTCPEGYYQTPDCGCASTIPPCSITSCPSGYTLQNCNCVQQQTQPPSNNTTSEIEKPLTQQEFNKLKTDNSDNYKIKEKTNQIITTSDGVTHLGTLTIFKDKNVANHFFYYFTPNAGDGQFIAGGFYRIPDSQGNSSYTSYISSSSGSSSTSPTPTWYNYDIDDFPSGQGYYIDQTTGIEHSITISQNNTPATVINDPVNVCQGCSDWYLDNDGDGYEGGTQKSTTSPGVGWEQGASMGVDCDDNNASIKECNLPTPVSVTNIATCKCIDPTKKANFSNVSFVYNVLEYKTWVSWQDYQDCAIAARKQNEKSSLAGTNPVGAGYQVNTFIDKKRQEESGKTTPEMNMQKAIDIVAKNLKLGKPVMAGVMYERYKGADKFDGGTDGDNNNVATNHFVTIVGMGIDNGKPYFSYYDNYVDPFNDDGSVRSLSARELIGTKTLENRFYYYKDSVGNYYFADKTATTIQGAAHGTGLEYVLTEIRDNQ